MVRDEAVGGFMEGDGEDQGQNPGRGVVEGDIQAMIRLQERAGAPRG
jgi:hypothetical protein